MQRSIVRICVASLVISMVLVACKSTDDGKSTETEGPVSELAPFDNWIKFPSSTVVVSRPQLRGVEAALSVSLDAGSEEALELLGGELERSGFSSRPDYPIHVAGNSPGIAARAYGRGHQVVLMFVNGSGSKSLVRLTLLAVQ